MQEEVDLRAQQIGKLFSRRFADGLELGAALAQHDAALAVARDHDLLVDFDRAVLAILIAFGRTALS
jgi:hypothetical protein